MRAYRGCDKDFRCDGRHHACKNPFQIFEYYPPAESRYCLVDLDEEEQGEDNSKNEKGDMQIVEEVGLPALIDAGIAYIKEHAAWEDAKAPDIERCLAVTNMNCSSVAGNTKDKSAAASEGFNSIAANTGFSCAATSAEYSSVAANTGYYSAATSAGNESVAANAGDYSAAMSTQRDSVAANTGKYSAAAATESNSIAANTGAHSMALSTGEQSAALSMGAMSAASAEGGESIAVSLGLLGKAKGKLGCFLVLAEWKEIDGAYHMVDIKTAKVDGKTIRPDTFYTIIDGEFTEEE